MVRTTPATHLPLTEPTFYILLSLAQRPKHGYAIMQDVRGLSSDRVILSTSNLGDRTCFEVLSRELDKYLRPSNEDFSDGRFIACKKGFQDPVVFSKGREITITGVIRSIRSGRR